MIKAFGELIQNAWHCVLFTLCLGMATACFFVVVTLTVWFLDRRDIVL
jgi:hypothetical protein